MIQWNPNAIFLFQPWNLHSSLYQWEFQDSTDGGTVAYKAIFWGYIPLHRPYIGLIYGRYLHYNHWIGLREHLPRKPWVFTMKLIWFSCKCSHHPILWYKRDILGYIKVIIMKWYNFVEKPIKLHNQTSFRPWTTSCLVISYHHDIYWLVVQ